MNIKFFIYPLGLIFLLTFCGCSTTQKLNSNSNPEFEDWKKERIADLKSPFGWLSLTGLYWLKIDSLTLGTKEGFDINLNYHAAANMGTILRKNEDWLFKPFQPNRIKHEGDFVNDEIEIKHDQTGKPTILNYESLFWYVIKREDNYGIRLKDTLNPARLEFSFIPTFDFDPNFVKNTKVKWASVQDSILITNAQGVVSSYPLKGWLIFDHLGKTQSLAGTDGGNDNWFIVFGDETNSGQTYGAGRFLYVTVQKDARNSILDFNRAINPPCYFTEFATCPLPPSQNRLAVEILAGEQAEH